MSNNPLMSYQSPLLGGTQSAPTGGGISSLFGATSPQISPLLTSGMSGYTPSALLDNFTPTDFGNNGSMSFTDRLFGTADGKFGGVLAPSMQALSGLGQGWLGFQQLGLAKDQFNFQKNFSTQQFNQQAGLLNSQMRDRQVARTAGGSSVYTPVSQYMKQNEVKSYNG